MRQIVRALLAQREALLGPMPDGSARFSKTPTFYDESDLALADRPYPLVYLRGEPGPSSVTAVVPVRVTETVVVQSEEGSLKLLDEVTDGIVRAVNERPFFGFDATIHRATWAGTKYVTGPGNDRKTVTTWNALMSWRAR